MGRCKGRCPLTPFRDCIGHTSMLLPRLDWGDARGCCHLTPFRDCVGHFFILLPRVYPQDTHTFPCFPTGGKKQSTSEKNPLATLTTSLQGGATTLKPTQRIGAMLLISSMLLTGVSVAEDPSNPPAATEALVTAAPTEAPTATPAQEQPTEQSADVPTETPAPENPTDVPSTTPAPENPTDAPSATPDPENPTDEPTERLDRRASCRERV